MTSTAATTRTTSAASRTPALAALGLGLSAVLTCIGTFWSRNDPKDNAHGMGDWLVAVGVAAVATALVFGLVVRTASEGNPGRRALVSSVFGVLSVAVFWAGLPLVLAAAALACALAEKDTKGSFGSASKVAVGLAVLTAGSAAALAFLG
ncbi:MAG: hypothetical protein ABIO67_00030 [Mycobacteriales bacterium]